MRLDIGLQYHKRMCVCIFANLPRPGQRVANACCLAFFSFLAQLVLDIQAKHVAPECEEDPRGSEVWSSCNECLSLLSCPASCCLLKVASNHKLVCQKDGCCLRVFGEVGRMESIEVSGERTIGACGVLRPEVERCGRLCAVRLGVENSRVDKCRHGVANLPDRTAPYLEGDVHCAKAAATASSESPSRDTVAVVLGSAAGVIIIAALVIFLFVFIQRKRKMIKDCSTANGNTYSQSQLVEAGDLDMCPFKAP